jgi:hypothetical protein
VPMSKTFAQPSSQICANAVFTLSLPISFSNGTAIPFTVDFGTGFSSISEVDAISTYDSAHPFGNGSAYFLSKLGGQQTQASNVTTMMLMVLDPSVTHQFLDGTYQDKYLDEKGVYTLKSLKICITGESVLRTVCLATDVQHWDNIVFMITDPSLANKTNLTANTELDVKILNDPHKVADIKQNVLDFLNAPTAPKNSIRILNVDYAIICAVPAPSPPPALHIIQS